MHKTARYTTEQMRCYSEGYYFGVIMALRVAVLAIDRYRLATRARRAIVRRKRSA